MGIFDGLIKQSIEVPLHLKSDNLQYDTVDRWVAGTNDLSTKRLMFQVFFFHNFLQNP